MTPDCHSYVLLLFNYISVVTAEGKLRSDKLLQSHYLRVKEEAAGRK
jgi:hypothetical protein